MITPVIRTIGKHKIPRFIYHMTNKKNYESIVSEGVIKTSEDPLLGQGVFTIELTNFFKRWRRSHFWHDDSLQQSLLQQVSKGRDEIVILRIPTANLDADRLVIRSQNRLLGWQESDKGEVANRQIKNMTRKPQPNSTNWSEKIRCALRDIITEQESEKYASHLTSGTPAKMSGLYKQRKEALEYVYMDNIPISYAEKIGEVNLEELLATAEFDPLRPMKSILTNLLKGTPEAKGAELLNC